MGEWGFLGNKSKCVYSDSADKDIVGTIDDPVFQTMQEGLTGYRFDVPDGYYVVDLLFAETKLDTAGKRVFGISINGKRVAREIDLAKEAGRNRAVIKTLSIAVIGGLQIEFTPLAGDPVLSGIHIRRL